MTTAILTAYDLSNATKVGRRTYRKQILPLDTIEYKGRKITFDREYLTDLATAFKEGAYDQVPFVLADEENRHNMNPEKFRGEVKALELTADGLDAILEVSEDGAALLERNPRLGVSARLVEGLSKANGKTFKRAVQHVLGTMDPRVTGLRPWQAVDLSEGDANIQVVDLTTETYEKGNDVTTPVQDEQTTDTQVDEDTTSQPLDLSGLTDAEFDALLEAADVETTDDEGAPDSDPKPDVAPQVTDVDPDSVDDDEDDDEDDEDVVVKDDTVDTDLSVATQKTRDDLTQTRIDLAQERYKAERKALVQAGVPPFLIDLAEPLLASPEAVTIDLSNADEPVNATEAVRKILNGVKGMIDIRPEIGHQVDLSATEDDVEAALLAQWDTEYGTA